MSDTIDSLLTELDIVRADYLAGRIDWAAFDRAGVAVWRRAIAAGLSKALRAQFAATR